MRGDASCTLYLGPAGEPPMAGAPPACMPRMAMVVRDA